MLAPGLLLGMNAIKHHEMICDFCSDTITLKDGSTTFVQSAQSRDPAAFLAMDLDGIAAPPFERVSHHEVTIWGTTASQDAMEELLERYPRLFVDDGKIANIDEKDWMTVPLQPDWETRGVRLAHRVYSLSQRDRDVVDKVFDKLHTQDRV